MAQSIGGFFASLVLKSDDASFDKTRKQLKEVDDTIRKTGLGFATFVGDVLKGFTAIGAGAVGAAYAVGNIQAKMALTAKSAGLGYTEMSKWSTAMKLIHLDSSTLTGSMGAINKVLQDYKVGLNPEGYSALAEDLAMLQKNGAGINISDFAKAGSGTERAQMLASAVEGQRGTEKYQGSLDLAEKIMPGIADLIQALNVNRDMGSGPTTVSGLLAASGQKQLMTSSNIKEAVQGSRSLDSLNASIDQVFQLFGTKMLTAFKPIITDITNWIDSHKGEITKFFTDAGNALAGIARQLGPVFSFMGDMARKGLDQGIISDFGSKNPRAKSSIEYALSQKLGMAIPHTLSGDIEATGALFQGKGEEYEKRINDFLSKEADLMKQASKMAESGPINLYVNVDKSGNVSLSKTGESGGIFVGTLNK